MSYVHRNGALRTSNHSKEAKTKTMSAKKEARTKRILEILSEQKKVDVAMISEQLGVSQVTIRKDLDELEEKGFIKRTHGFAELNTSDLVSGRLAYHYDEKKLIATEAAKLVDNGDTIMIENGSCCALLARTLAETKQNLTIITNSAFIADYIREYRNIQTILLGGLYQHESQCLVGPMIRDNVANFHVKNFFIGTDGWSERIGFTNKDPMRAQAVRDMACSCDNIVILTESEKFSQIGTMPMNIKDQPKLVITDNHIPDNIISILTTEGIEIIMAAL